MFDFHQLSQLFATTFDVLFDLLIKALQVSIKSCRLIGDLLLKDFHFCLYMLESLIVELISTNYMLECSHYTHRNVIPLFWFKDT